MNTKSMQSSKSFVLAAMTLAVLPLARGVAAPPGGGGSAPPVVDIAYMEGPNTTIRGLQVSTSGTASGDVALWKLTNFYGNSMSWSPDGSSLTWSQDIDRKATHAIVVGRPGSAPTTVLTFPSGGVTRRHGGDILAWGRGCNGGTVIVFLGDEIWEYLDAIYVFDPVAGGRPQRLHVMKHGPEYSPDRGHGFAFSPQGQHLAFVEQDDAGVNYIAALPLTCLPGASLPSPAGEPQRLFTVQADEGIEGRGWTTGLDWSPDGRRVAASIGPLLVWVPGMRSWGTSRIAVGELTYSDANGVEQVSVAEPAMHTVTAGPPAGQTDYSDDRPSWGRSGATAACDRIAFTRSSVLMLLDVPRAGYTSVDCAVPAPTKISSKSVVGLDWK